MDANELAVPAAMAKIICSQRIRCCVLRPKRKESSCTWGGQWWRRSCWFQSTGNCRFAFARACFIKLTAPLQVFNDQENHQ
jgi:hypothetical protein